jgi:hypothetical protein
MQILEQTPREKSTLRGVYQFWRDPVCLVGWALYALNRFLLAPRFGQDFPFLYEHFNDSLLVPAALPPFIWARQQFGLRHASGVPTIREIVVVTLIASVVFEWFGPKYLGHSIGDWGDVAVYWLGALVAGAYWIGVRSLRTSSQ